MKKTLSMLLITPIAQAIDKIALCTILELWSPKKILFDNPIPAGSQDIP